MASSHLSLSYLSKLRASKQNRYAFVFILVANRYSTIAVMKDTLVSASYNLLTCAVRLIALVRDAFVNRVHDPSRLTDRRT